jgi:hypothetical protein
MKKTLLAVALTAASFGLLAGFSATESMDSEIQALRSEITEVAEMPPSEERYRSLAALQVASERLAERYPGSETVKYLRSVVDAHARAIYKGANVPG